MLTIAANSAMPQERLPCPGAYTAAAWTNCIGTHTFPNGRTYAGEFRDGKRNGHGSMVFPNGERYEGAYRDGNRNGRGTLTLPNGEKYIGDFRNGRYDGKAP